MQDKIPVEMHPLAPFLPAGAKILMLGSFPPKRERWSMEFFYPNFNNDMWRIFGLVFFGDKSYFISADGKRFDREKVMDLCEDKGVALYDTAAEVRRLKDNASDKFLEIVSPTDIPSLLSGIPMCRAIVTTGQKAAETAADAFGCPVPAPGSFGEITCGTGCGAPSSEGGPLQANGHSMTIRRLRLWRMPSSSRAYPLSLDRKAEAYRKMFSFEGLV